MRPTTMRPGVTMLLLHAAAVQLAKDQNAVTPNDLLLL